MIVEPTPLSGLLRIQPDVFADSRGYFQETWNEERYHEAGLSAHFVQDNVSMSRRGTLRGLHFQNPRPQGKLVWVFEGAVFDVAVDVRPGSPTFGRWYGAELSADNHTQLYLPPGYAHGFQVLTDRALFAYKCTDVYHRQGEVTIAWNDPDIGVEWPMDVLPVLSDRDAQASRLRDIPAERLLSY